MKRESHRRQGVTLLELLVVVFILALLGATAIRVLRPSVEKSQVREAGRLVATMLGQARALAMQNRRSFGVMFEPLSVDPNASMKMVLVAVPPAYAGGCLDSRVKLSAPSVSPVNSAWYRYTPSFVGCGGSESLATSQVSVGDLIQFNYQGHLFRIENIVTANVSGQQVVSTMDLSCSTLDTTVTFWPKATPNGDPGLAYQIFRQPQPTGSVAVELPAGSIVDLYSSGVGSGKFPPNASQKIMVTFTPTGLLDLVYYPPDVGDTDPNHAYVRGRQSTENVYFLVGRPEGAGTSLNLQDLRSVWVTITCQTGLIATEFNAKVGAGTPDVTSAADRKAARKLAAAGTSMGG